jgi:hypothetical protein
VAVLRWLTDNKDLVVIGISFLALLVGLVTVLIARSQARLANYARMHEALIDGSASKGRRLLFVAAETDKFPLPSDDTAIWDDINQALAAYDTLGVYFDAGLVPKGLVLRTWHHPLKAIVSPARAFVRHRTRLGIGQPWNGLNTLLQEAEKVKCDCAFCRTHRLDQAAFQPLSDGPSASQQTIPAGSG